MNHLSGRAIDSFLQARKARPNWFGIPTEHRPRTIDEAYRLQAAIHDRLVGEGRRLEGYKVGSTSAAGQAIYGLTEPVYAGIFDRTRSRTLSQALSAPMMAPSIECEIALVLSRDLDGSDFSMTLSDVADACLSCHVACEIIDNRYGNPHDVGVPTLLAEDFFHEGFILGPAAPRWRECGFVDLDAKVEVNGRSYTGDPRAVLSPLQSVLWLARRLASNGLGLRAGHIVLTGSIVPPVPLPPDPKSVSLTVEGFGRIELD